MEHLEQTQKRMTADIVLDTQDCAILAEDGPAGRHSRGTLRAVMRAGGRCGVVRVRDRADGLIACVIDLGGA